MRWNPLWLGLAVLVLLLAGNVAASAADFDLTASDGTYTNRILLEWEKVSGPVPVGYYVIYRSENGGRFREIATRDSRFTSYRDTRVFPCNVYAYYVSVVWDYSPRPESNVDEGYTLITPATPQGMSWSELPLLEGLELSWDAVSAAQYYEIRRHATQTSSAIRSWTTERPTVQFTDIGPCTPSYWVDVRSCSDCGCSAWSDLLQQPPADAAAEAPSGQVVVAASVGMLDQINLSWTALADTDSYEMYRADTQTDSYALLDTIEVDHYTDTSVQGCRDYWYKVRGCTGDYGCGPFSEPVSGSSIASIPTAPTNLDSAKVIDQCAFAFTWDAVPGATYYEITYSQYPSGVSSYEVATVQDPVYVRPGPDACSPVCDYAISVRVAACNCSGCSAESYGSASWRTVDIGEIPAPANLTSAHSTSDGEGSTLDIGPAIVLTWDPVSNATHYQVFVEPFEDQTDPDLSQSRQSVVDPVCTEANQALGLAKYWVRGCCCCTCGPFASLTAAKSAPAQSVQGLQASEGSMAHGISVSWDSLFGITGPLVTKGYYQVERTHGDEASEVVWTGQDNAFFDRDVIPCEPYSYAVVACNETGCGPKSEPVVGWAGTPRTPAVTLIPEEGDSPATLKWISIPGAEYYEVRRLSQAQADPQSTSSGELVAVVMGPHPLGTYVTYPIEKDSSLSGYYYYTVLACNGCGCSSSDGLFAVYH